MASTSVCIAVGKPLSRSIISRLCTPRAAELIVASRCHISQPPLAALVAAALTTSAIAFSQRRRQLVLAEERPLHQRLGRWEERWNANQTSWHRLAVNRHLLNHSAQLAPEAERSGNNVEPRMLFPLCGKSLDMAFMSRRGYSVVGIEGVAKAIHEFAQEQGLTETAVPVALPPALDAELFKMHAILIGSDTPNRLKPPPPVLLLEGDFLSIGPSEAAAIVPFPAAFDRGGLVAVEPPDRPRYARVLADLIEPGGRILLVSVEHDPFSDGRLGPPFEIVESEIRDLFKDTFDVHLLQREDLSGTEDGMLHRGCKRFFDCVYLLVRKSLLEQATSTSEPHHSRGT